MFYSLLIEKYPLLDFCLQVHLLLGAADLTLPSFLLSAVIAEEHALLQGRQV